MDQIETYRAAWLAAAVERRSRRTYDEKPADRAALDALEAVCRDFRPHSDVRVELVREPAVDVFRGVIGGYGKVTGAPHVLVVIADTQTPFHQQHSGYSGEAAILAATAAGLDTCWVGGFFSPRRVAELVTLSPHERVLCVSPAGHAVESPSSTERAMTGMARSRSRKPVEVIAPGIDGSWPSWARVAVEAARIAPSATNRQPWRFAFDGEGLSVSRDSRIETPKVTKALDCGIAMLHAELAAREAGVAGCWHEIEVGLEIARYVPDGGPR